MLDMLLLDGCSAVGLDRAGSLSLFGIPLPFSTKEHSFWSISFFFSLIHPMDFSTQAGFVTKGSIHWRKR